MLHALTAPRTAFRDSRVSISARFMYSITSWSDEVLRDGSRAQKLTQRPTLVPRLHADPIECGRGAWHAGTSPCRGVHLSTTWPLFRDDAVSDNDVFSELDPTTAPVWMLNFTTRKQSKLGSICALLSRVSHLNYHRQPAVQVGGRLPRQRDD